MSEEGQGIIRVLIHSIPEGLAMLLPVILQALHLVWEGGLIPVLAGWSRGSATRHNFLPYLLTCPIQNPFADFLVTVQVGE